MPGIGLMLVGPALAWALLPMLFSPYTESFLSPYGWIVLLVWLPLSALVSTCALGLFMQRTTRAQTLAAAAISAAHADQPLVAAVPASARPLPLYRRVPRAMLIGAAAFVLLIPLAVTSTAGWQRRLGRRWRTLHRLVYAAAVLSVLLRRLPTLALAVPPEQLERREGLLIGGFERVPVRW